MLLVEDVVRSVQPLVGPLDLMQQPMVPIHAELNRGHVQHEVEGVHDKALVGDARVGLERRLGRRKEADGRRKEEQVGFEKKKRLPDCSLGFTVSHRTVIYI